MIVVSLEDAGVSELGLGAAMPTANTLRTKYVGPVPRLPDGRVVVPTSKFRTASRPDHMGVDLLVPLWASDGRLTKPYTDGEGKWWFPGGWPAVSVADGVVGRSLDSDSGGYIRIDHAGGVSSQYVHLAERWVKVGDRVRKGQAIGIIGEGDTHQIHLHFQMMLDKIIVDPAPFLAHMPVIDNPLLPRGRTGLWALAGLAVAGGALAYYLRSRRRPIWR